MPHQDQIPRRPLCTALDGAISALMRAVLLVAAALAALSVPVYAQVPLEAEAWVRLDLASGPRIQGEVSAVDPGTIVLLLRNGTDSIIPLAEIRRADVRVSHQRRGSEGFMATLVGVSAGLGILSAVTYSPCPECWLGPSSRERAFVSGAVFGGVIIGLPAALIVATRSVSEWDEGLLPDFAAPATDPRRTSPLASASLQIAPAAGKGMSVGLSVPIGGRR
jgi:hypothetical protein